MKGLLSIMIILGILGISGFLFAEEAVTSPPAPPSTWQAGPAQSSPAPVAASATPAPKIDTGGDTAWMIVATAFVMLITATYSCYGHFVV